MVHRGTRDDSTQLPTTDCAPCLSEACGGLSRDRYGPDVAARLEALGEQLPVLGSTADPNFMEKLLLASSYVSTARRDIQRHVRTPIPLSDASALSELLKTIGGILTLESITTALRRPVSGQELIDTGYQLLDTSSEYFILAQHFYSKEAIAARAERPSDVVEAEIAAVSRRATSLKASVMEYLKKVEEALESPGLRH